MNIPNDPLMLMSFLNEKLRGRYDSLESLCDDFQLDQEAIIKKLEAIHYTYDPKHNQFKQ
jgi:hypothetical protein